MLKSHESEPNADEKMNRHSDKTTGDAPDGPDSESVDDSSTGAGSRNSVDCSSTSVRRVAGVAPVLSVGANFDLSAWIPAVPWWFTWILLPFLMTAGLWWAIRERSVSGAADRGKRNAKRTMWLFGVVGSGVAGGLLGGLEGIETLMWHFGYMALDHWEILAKLGAVVGSWSVLERATALGVYEIMTVLGVLFLLVLTLDDD